MVPETQVVLLIVVNDSAFDHSQHAYCSQKLDGSKGLETIARKYQQR